MFIYGGPRSRASRLRDFGCGKSQAPLRTDLSPVGGAASAKHARMSKACGPRDVPHVAALPGGLCDELRDWRHGFVSDPNGKAAELSVSAAHARLHLCLTRRRRVGLWYLLRRATSSGSATLGRR